MVTSKQQSRVRLYHAMYCAQTTWQTTPCPTEPGRQTPAKTHEKTLARKILLHQCWQSFIRATAFLYRLAYL